MNAYLFVHFREKTTPDGEQVHFGLSKDGFHWEAVNNGAPVLWTYWGTKGVRDFTIVRHPLTRKVTILATDLSIAYGYRAFGPKRFWKEVSEHGSKKLCIWESDDLVHWSEGRLETVGAENFGCVWAPDAIFDPKTEEFILHWSSSTSEDAFEKKRIYYSRTKDFRSFTPSQVLYAQSDSSVIDSAMYEENGKYYLFVKTDQPPVQPILLCSDAPTGPFTRMEAFDRTMASIHGGQYEAPTAVKLSDGRWCLFLDYYGARGAGQGYVPFLCSDLSVGEFARSDEQFSFPYGFKHGTILPITMEEYDRIRNFDWSDQGYAW